MCTVIDSTRVVTKICCDAHNSTQTISHFCDNPELLKWLSIAIVLSTIIVCLTVYLVVTNKQKKTVKSLVKDYLSDSKLLKEAIEDYHNNQKK